MREIKKEKNGYGRESEWGQKVRLGVDPLFYPHNTYYSSCLVILALLFNIVCA